MNGSECCLKILKTITVKQVLTESSREALMKKFISQKQQLEKECEQLRFELKKYEKNRKNDSRLFTNQIDKEIAQRKEKQKLAEFQIEQLNLLEPGSELKDQELQAVVDINVGDDWEQLINNQSIIIKDGKVIEIRP